MWQPVDAHTERPLTWPANAWPVVIHGQEKSGASLYTVALTADFIRRGWPVVFICAHGEAIRTLQRELGIGHPLVRSPELTTTNAETLEDMQLVTLMRKKGFDLPSALEALHDWRERIVVVKNIESVLTPDLWQLVGSHHRCVLAGDAVTTPIDLGRTTFGSTMLFSDAPATWTRQRPTLPTYVGYGFRGARRFQTILREA